MRKVSLERLNPQMILGKSVSQGTSVLIKEGTADLQRYERRLENLGIYDLIIDDEIGKGIDLEEVVSDITIMTCKETLEVIFRQLQNKLVLDRNKFHEMIQSLVDEVLSNSNVLIGLNHIGSVEDNTLDHSVNVTIYAIYIGVLLNYTRDRLVTLAEGAFLHDIGKLLLDRKILYKKAPLEEEEFEYLKSHTTLGYELLQNNRGISEVAKQIVLYHHERMDASGYPKGLNADEILEQAMIVGIADIYAALTVARCYHKAYSSAQAIEILMEDNIKNKLDSEILTLFLQNISAYPTGTSVWLSDGREAVVKKQNPSFPLRPVVRTIRMEGGQEFAGEEINLLDVLNLTIVENVVS